MAGQAAGVFSLLEETLPSGSEARAAVPSAMIAGPDGAAARLPLTPILHGFAQSPSEVV